MLPAITLPEAKARHWDVVIAGSSFAAMFFARALPAGLSVLIVEKGGVQDHDAQLERGTDGRETFRQNNTSGHEKEWVAHTTFGGNSNCWWACTPRFHPHDFQMATRYGVGDDWPFDYETLEPVYAEVEAIMEIAGGGSDHVLPRSAPFPYPPHVPSRTDMRFRAASDLWFAQPTARANGGSRASCCANGVCNLCPVDSKYTILNGIDAFARAGLHLLSGTEIRAVKVEAGRATGVLVRQEGRDTEIAADLVALGTNAIFNAAILLRSGAGGPGVGRGLNEQTARIASIDAAGLGLFGGTSITGHGYALYDGPWRSEVSGTLIEIYNSPFRIRPERDRWTDRAVLKLIVEDLPQDRNHVRLDQDEPLIEWHGHHDYALRGLDRAIAELPGILPVEIEAVSLSDMVRTEAHILGTHRMGPDPARHVTDGDMRLHDVPNLYALGGGCFPTSSPANPSLTIAALSTRAARSLA